MPSYQPIAAIAAIAAERDPQAWADLVDRYQHTMLWTARVILGNDPDAEDAVQEALLLVRDHAHRFVARPGEDQDEQVRRWLLRITANCAISWRRHERMRRGQPLDAVQTQAVPDPAGSPHADSETLGALNDALADLREEERRPIVLHYFLGLDHRALAGELRCTPVAARKRLSRALGLLRQRLIPKEGSARPIVAQEALDGMRAALSLAPPFLATTSLAGWKGLIEAPGRAAMAPEAMLGVQTTALAAPAPLPLVVVAGLGLAIGTGLFLTVGARPPVPVPLPAMPARIADALPPVHGDDDARERPAWATASGRDAFGLWADMPIPAGNGLVQRFRRIPPGTFLMGSPAGEPGREDGKEFRHRVTLRRGFWLADTEVTQGAWQAVMGSNPSQFTGDTILDLSESRLVPRTIPPGLIDFSRLPVERVSWNVAVEFHRRLQRLVPGLPAIGFPGEAQWEYACRAGSDGLLSAGSDPRIDMSDLPLEELPHEVQARLPNAWGLHGMHDNVREWCRDAIAPYPLGAIVDPMGPATGMFMVNRGGAFYSSAEASGSARRMLNRPDDRLWHLGLRLCIEDPPLEPQGIERITTQTWRDSREALAAAGRMDPVLARLLAEPADGPGWRAWSRTAGPIQRQVLGILLTAVLEIDEAGRAAALPRLAAFIDACPADEHAWVQAANAWCYAVAGGDRMPAMADLERADRLVAGLQAALAAGGSEVHGILDTIACVRFRQGRIREAATLWERAIRAAGGQAPALYRQRLDAARNAGPDATPPSGPVPVAPADF